MSKRSLLEYDKKLLGAIYRNMVLIREFELKVNRLFLQLGVGVPGHSKELTALDLHGRKE